MKLFGLKRTSLLLALTLLLTAGAQTGEAAKKPTYAGKMQLGQLLYFNGNVDGAIRAFEYAAYLNPSAFEPHLNLVNLYVQKGGEDGVAKAVEECHAVLKIKPGHKDVHLILGNLLRTMASLEKDTDKQNQYLDGALEALTKAEEFGASGALIENTKGLICLQQQKFDQALKHINSALEKQNNFPDAHLVRAVLLFKQATAGQEASKVLADLGSDAAKKKQVDEVLDELDIAIKQKDKNAEAHNTKADILYAMGKHEEALKEYKLATEDEPRFAQAWAGIGNAHLQAKNLEGAKHAYRRAKEIKPDDKNIIYGLAVMLEKEGNVQAAIEEFAEGLQLETDPMMRAQITTHIQQLQGRGGFGGFGGFNIGLPGHNPLLRDTPLAQPYADLIKIGGGKEAKSKDKE